jgi:hypothetical protein
MKLHDVESSVLVHVAVCTAKLCAWPSARLILWHWQGLIEGTDCELYFALLLSWGVEDKLYLAFVLLGKRAKLSTYCLHAAFGTGIEGMECELYIAFLWCWGVEGKLYLAVVVLRSGAARAHGLPLVC